MKKKLFGFMKTDKRGLALISVLGVVTLATILVMALFTVADAEKRAAETYAEGNAARHLANSAIDIVKNQIQAAATGATVSADGPVIWASQPGAVRTYDQNGVFAEGRTLFSSSAMVTKQTGGAGEENFMNGTGDGRGRFDQEWDQKPDQWVDLNLPVIRVPATGVTGVPEVIFPVMDPRSADETSPIQPVEGFNYNVQAIGIGAESAEGNRIRGVVTTDEAGLEVNRMRCPMPVEWLYVLKDGSVGNVSASSGQGAAQWVAGTGVAPTEENPIVGRVAFWTDDESSKVNLNTAGEPSPWLAPTAYHTRDVGFANNQPVVAEYQRYPGHPATVSISTILNPGYKWDTYVAPANAASLPTRDQKGVDFKERLYGMLPRLGAGGTMDGTRVFDVDAFQSSTASNVDWSTMQRERLFVSPDEAVFSERFVPSGREPRLLSSTEGGVSVNSPTNLLSPERLNRTKFFLTAASSSPETNMFGLPRVAIWPLPDISLGRAYRTGYDYAVELASTLGPQGSKNIYAFSRIDSRSHSMDMGVGMSSESGVARNALLMKYLDNLIKVSMPGGESLFNKYKGVSTAQPLANDARQVLVQIFDYIRCTNLFDSYLNERTIANNTIDFRDNNTATGGKPVSDIAVHTDTPKFGRFYTYTEPRFNVLRRGNDVYGLPNDRQSSYPEERVMTGAYPGHGQVRPIEHDFGDGVVYKGLGRFPTVSEVALHFICTGDGRPSSHSFRVPKRNKEANTDFDDANIYSGGRVAQMLDTTQTNKRLAVTNGNEWARWYSNIPPFPLKSRFEEWGMDVGTVQNPVDPNSEFAASRHPGWNPRNWNVTLDRNTPLLDNQKRIQVALLVEMFVPAAGWTKYVPDWTLVLDGNTVNGIKVDNKAIFQTTGPQVVQSTSAYVGGSFRGMSEGDNVYPMGGAYGTGALLNSRRVKAQGEMPKDPGYNDTAGASVHGAMQNFPLVSSFFTINYDRTDAVYPGGKIEFTGTPLRMDLYASHDWEGIQDPRGKQPVQSFEINFAGGGLPAPDLVVHSTERREWTDDNGNKFQQEAVPAVRWWSFSYGGAVNRFDGEGTLGATNPWVGTVQEVPEGGDTGIAKTRTWGRFHGEPRTSVDSSPARGYAYHDSAQEQVSMSNGSTATVSFRRGGQVLCGGIIYGFSTNGAYNGTKSWAGVDERGELYGPTGGFAENGTIEDNKFRMGRYDWWGTDSIRSMVPKHGDYRVVAAMKTVPADMWMKHPVWEKLPTTLFAHNLSSFSSNSQVGAHMGSMTDPNLSAAENRIVPNAWYNNAQIPDAPMTELVRASAVKHGDFDNGTGVLRDGAYINKPDDGNMSVMSFWHGAKQPNIYRLRNAYFTQSWIQVPSQGGFFSPNRLVPSPGVFGSLPTGVFGSRANSADLAHATSAGVGWRTLLFRADARMAGGGLDHEGGPAVVGTTVSGPADHLWMDLFWMPIVDPRPASYAMATEGKINMNYQILPFRHIRRATAMHAALKGEFISAYDHLLTAGVAPGTNAANPNNTLIYKTARDSSVFPHRGWSEFDKMRWHRPIDIERTLWQFDARFKMGGAYESGIREGLFRTASQICEIHLVPGQSDDNDPLSLSITNKNLAFRTEMSKFYASRRITGDNTRERVYANIYQKLTTKSNAFRIFYKAQTIKKAKSLSPMEVDTTKDSVTAEYQGSALLQRYLDVSSNALPDYARLTSPAGRENSLEQFYRYRVLEMKQFAP